MENICCALEAALGESSVLEATLSASSWNGAWSSALEDVPSVSGERLVLLAALFAPGESFVL